MMAIGDKKAVRIKRLEEARARGEKPEPNILPTFVGRGRNAMLNPEIIKRLFESSKQVPSPPKKGPFINLDRMDAFAHAHSSKCGSSGSITLDLYVVRREGGDRETGRVFVKCRKCGDTKDVTDDRTSRSRMQ